MYQKSEQNSYFITQNKRTRLLETDSSHKVCKKFKVTGPEHHIESLLILMYSKRSTTLIVIKQNSYFGGEQNGNEGF